MTGRAEVPEIDTWEGMIDWLVESFSDQPTGLTTDLGPSGYGLFDEGLGFDSHGVDGLELDRWFCDDCTDGYLFTRDIALAADACVPWFRDVPVRPCSRKSAVTTSPPHPAPSGRPHRLTDDRRRGIEPVPAAYPAEIPEGFRTVSTDPPS